MTAMRRLTGREWKVIAWILVALFGIIQVLPVGAERTNPPVIQEPAWDSARTRELFFRACADCHTNTSKWPWYSHVAPASWLVVNDVEEGREHLNASEWNRPQKHARHAAKEVREGDMPLWLYAAAHPRARLSDGERRELVAGLEKTFGVPGPEDRRGRGDD
jgi:mono/diheme cytochrome c family protein